MPAALATAETVMFSELAPKDNLKVLSPLTVIHFPFVCLVGKPCSLQS